MRRKNKQEIARGVAKNFWNDTTDVNLRLKILEEYLYDYIYSSDYISTHEDLIHLSKTDWAGLALYDCDIPISHRRDSICHYIGIGDFEGYTSNNKEYLREYKLRILKLKNE